MVRNTSIKLLIALAVKNGMQIDQMDAVTAFLQGNLDKEIYMEMPEGCKNKLNKVCLLRKSIYGLKQSSRQWNKTLEKEMKNYGLRKSRADPCVFFNESKSLIVAIYVDDILIFWKNKTEKDNFKEKLSKTFKMKDIGKAKNCLGINLTYEDGAILIDQTKFIEEMLDKINMKDCKPIATPSDTQQKLSTDMCPKTEEQRSELSNIPYREAVGSLLYLSQGSRPDIAFAVNDTSKYNNNFGKAHWTAVKRIMRYLQGTKGLKLKYSKDKDSKLTGFSDSDWASDVDKRRSCTGYAFSMCGGAISWGSRRQPTVALSSTEAEYMALTATIQEGLWLSQIKAELDVQSDSKEIHIRADNQSAIALSNEGYRARSKHIDVRHHFIREHVESGRVILKHIGTEDMAADFLTKPVPKTKHLYCASQCGLC